MTNDDDFPLWLEDAPPINSEAQNQADNFKPPKFSKDSMRDLANENLHNLLARMKRYPDAYKASEIITAAKEALDRTDGRAAQSVTVDTRNTVTHEHIVKLEPNEAYKRLIEGNIKVIEHEG